jgi:sulfite exporter TauE/SafE
MRRRNVIEGLLLGLSTGGSCLAFCAPVLLPYFVGEGKRITGNLPLLAVFLAGRLLGYILFGVLAWMVGWYLLSDFSGREWLFGAADMLLAMMLMGYGFGWFKGKCAAEVTPGRILNRLETLWLPLPFWLGLLTGLSLCPPFLLALNNAALSDTVWGSILFFLAFFAGTSLFLIPLTLAGFARRISSLQPVGRLTAGLVGCYFLYKGLMMILQGGLM